MLRAKGHKTRLPLDGRRRIRALLQARKIGVYSLAGLVGVCLVYHSIQRNQGVKCFVVSMPLNGDDLVYLHGTGGDGARLVQADHVHARQGLHAVEFLHQDLVLGQTHHAHRQHTGGKQDEALGDHANQRSAGVQDRILQRAVCPDDLFDHEQRSQRHDRNRDPFDDALEGIHDLALGLAVDLGCVVDARGVVVRAHGHDLRRAGARADKAAGVELVAALLCNKVALACEQALVGRALAAHDAAVAGHLVAALEDDEVVEHDVAEAHIRRLPVANHMRLGGGDDRESVDGHLGAHLLEDTDADVAQDDTHKE